MEHQKFKIGERVLINYSHDHQPKGIVTKHRMDGVMYQVQLDGREVVVWDDQTIIDKEYILDKLVEKYGTSKI